jgi:hypothetical protein
VEYGVKDMNTGEVWTLEAANDSRPFGRKYGSLDEWLEENPLRVNNYRGEYEVAVCRETPDSEWVEVPVKNEGSVPVSILARVRVVLGKVFG